jgi:hypothetical protein
MIQKYFSLLAGRTHRINEHRYRSRPVRYLDFWYQFLWGRVPTPYYFWVQRQ